ncbi:uncharacterized protein LOC117830199 [Notolabrus celidotus]|uniref:uncharacterized protein LOC117830199 n=1 Tax=Notolabrus celidotus TaxID=1203425 RepID=UPI00148FFAD1|nr:uncharacterized protein LOC117830199 [Notolabrus celidotus]
MMQMMLSCSFTHTNAHTDSGGAPDFRPSLFKTRGQLTARLSSLKLHQRSLSQVNMNFFHQQLSHMRPLTFSERERQRYKAEKMLLRQFVLLKREHRVPECLSTEDMKRWLLGGRSFNTEFQGTAGMNAEELHLGELAWISVRRFCVAQMDREIREELEKEKRLSQLVRRKVTLEGLEMLLPIIRSRAEQDVRALLLQLSNKLLASFLDPNTGTRFKRALITKLQRTTQPLVPQVVKTALDVLLGEPGPHMEVMTPQSQGNTVTTDSDLRTLIETSSVLIGQQLADAAASCFCLRTVFFKDRLQQFCTSESRRIVTAIYERFLVRSICFRLLDFDESVFTARKRVLIVAQYMMEDRLQGATQSREPFQRVTEREQQTPEEHHVAAGNTDEEQEQQTGGLSAFFSQIWKRMNPKDSEQ